MSGSLPGAHQAVAVGLDLKSMALPRLQTARAESAKPGARALPFSLDHAQIAIDGDLVEALPIRVEVPPVPNDMREFEIYLPSTTNDGMPVDPGEIQRVKDELVKAFGGYTHFNQRSEGAWRMGGVTFRDEVTIVRVIDDASATFDMPGFRKSIEVSLKQARVLIVSREVSVV